MLTILLGIFGLIALIKGEFRVTKKRRVSGSTGRLLGIIMLLGALLSLFGTLGSLLGITALIATIVVGLMRAEPVG